MSEYIGGKASLELGEKEPFSIKHGMAWARLVEEQVRLACSLTGVRERW